MNKTAALVFEWHDTCTRFGFDVSVDPFIVAKLIENILERAISGHSSGLTEYNLPRVGGDVIMSVYISGDFFSSLLKVTPVISLERTELTMRNMNDWFVIVCQVFNAFHGFQCCYVVSRFPKIVCVNVNCVRHVK